MKPKQRKIRFLLHFRLFLFEFQSVFWKNEIFIENFRSFFPINNSCHILDTPSIDKKKHIFPLFFGLSMKIYGFISKWLISVIRLVSHLNHLNFWLFNQFKLIIWTNLCILQGNLKCLTPFIGMHNLYYNYWKHSNKIRETEGRTTVSKNELNAFVHAREFYHGICIDSLKCRWLCW